VELPKFEAEAWEQKAKSGNDVGTINVFQGCLQGLWSDQGLVNTAVSKTVCYGMEEVTSARTHQPSEIDWRASRLQVPPMVY